MIAVTPDGATVIVSGQSPGTAENGYSDWGTVAYDAKTGEQKWVNRHDGPAHGFDIPSAMAIPVTVSR
ncbi:hypothetical protein ONA70_02815 [Micromonospora yasonensis]|uniref:hypothetical protein n=1 Tax=Micromonospora yasonensis TaxID=1128667 RepID=UPI00222FA9FD|nr:hypothetical protein [Micromonospora yasonensis]MCW3839029.1 hypothetical protein [Micromonospora yasonensis]